MENKSLWKKSLSELTKLLCNDDIAVRDVVNSLLERIDQVEDPVHAWEALDREYVLQQAAELDDKGQKQERGILYGIPLGIKDIINTKVLPTRMGSPIWKDHHAGNDARVVAHLLWEDALVMGKTVTAEFAVHAPNGTRNPHCLQCTPGTSSSGSAAAVASGMVPAGLGSQTAGSLIRPASFCGVYAFKPTFGWLPRTGVLKTTDTLDQIGFHARDAHDLRPLFEAIRVRGRNYYLKEEKLSQNPEKGRWKVGIVDSHLSDFAPDYALMAMDRFAKSLASPCIEVERVALPEAFSRSHDIHGRIYDSDLAYYFKDEYRKQPELLSESLKEIIEHGLALSPDDYRYALAEQVELQNSLDKLFEEGGYDILITLASNGEAPFGEETVPWMDTCLIWTMCGVPTMSVPVFKGPHDMPYGAQLVGRRYGDNVMLGFVEHLREIGAIRSAEVVDPRESVDPR